MKTREELKLYKRQWYLKNKVKCNRKSKEWHKANPWYKEEYERTHTKERDERSTQWHEEHPWYYSYMAAKRRCYPSNSYGKRGIKFLMTMEDFKYLWFRDRAFEMDRPSIDRVSGKGSYELSNCRYIEFEENNKRPRIK